MNYRMESWAFYFLLATAILAPLAFWPSPYVSLELIKTSLIVIGTLISAILFGFVAIKEKRLALPPVSHLTMSILIVASLVISSLTSIHAAKSLFGQGFEIGTASFVALLFLAAFVMFTFVSRRQHRAITLYVGLTASFLILLVFQMLRLVLGADYMDFSILNSTTSSILGGWFNISSFAIVIMIISLSALSFLPVGRRMKILYWIMTFLAIASAAIVNDARAWIASTLVFLGLAIFMTARKMRGERFGFGSLAKKLAWIPLLVCILSAVMVWKGAVIVEPTVKRWGALHSELVLPWQMTLDVTASSIQNYPLFGVGPNHFAQAYMAYKPSSVNSTIAWSNEFSNGFGLIPTFTATQGIVGTVLWILFFVFMGIIMSRVSRRFPEDATSRFILVSSGASAVFLWIISIISVPSHAISFFAFLMTGVFLGAAVASGALPARVYEPRQGSGTRAMFTSLAAACVLVAVVWGLVQFKKTVAMAYFGGGIKELSTGGDPDKADAMFKKAIALDSSDIYWQGRAEASLAKANKLAGTITADTSASTSQAVLTEVGAALNEGIEHTSKAIAYDPYNYYNFMSQARLAEAAAAVRMDQAYENTVSSYVNAIDLNKFNPSLYLSLAAFQAKYNKLDDALQSAGAALRTKNNYLDAVFLISQIYAAKGDLPNAVTAARIATQLNPENPLLQFQLGLLLYSGKDYAGAAKSLAEAVKIQKDYANAKYFLGLSQARIGNTAAAIAQFSDLAESNPDNQEVALILENLQAGRSIFADAQPPITAAPEKRASLPIKEQR